MADLSSFINIGANTANFVGPVTSSNVISTIGNVTGGNLLAAGYVSVTGNVTGNYMLGNGSQLTNLPAPIVTQDITSNGYMSIMTYDGTIKYVNNATVEPSSGNIQSSGNISATGNISGSYVLGNGSQLTSLPGANSIANGNSNVSIASANSNITLAVGGIITGVISNAAIGIGNGTGNAQGTNSIAIGKLAGNIAQGSNSVAIGYSAASFISSFNTVAIGQFAGNSSQLGYAIAIGSNAASITQGSYSVAIGSSAGQNTQGSNSVAIGSQAGLSNQANNTIILNATGANVSGTSGQANSFYVAPVRNDVANIAEVMFYNTTSKEITYGNVISVSGNVTGGNIVTAGNVSGNTAGFAIGYRDVPQVSFAANTTIATTDAGKHYYSTLSTGNVLTIPNNASQGFQVGAAITVINQGLGNITVAQGLGVTLYLAGNATSGNRTVATFGMATLIKVATDTWFINGTGVS